MMDAPHPQENQTPKVLALGGLAAGAVGSLYVLLTERDKKPKSRMEVARHTLEDAAGRARKQAAALETNLEAGVASGLHNARATATSRGKKSRKEARKTGRRAGKRAQHEAELSRDRMKGMIFGAKDKSVEKLHELEKHAPEVNALASQMLGRTEESLGRAKTTGTKRARQAGKDARKAQGDLKTFVERAREKAPETRHYVETHVAPKVKDLEKQAAVALAQGRHRAEDLRKHAEKDVVPQVRDRAGRLIQRAEHDVVPQVKDSAERLKVRAEDQAKVAASVLEKGSAEAAHKLAEATGSVETHAKDAGTAVARGGREFRSLIVWLSLGGTLIYAVFLNDEQREKVREMAKSLFGETKGMYGDIKGQDGTFENA
jgi:hypothetical protein